MSQITSVHEGTLRAKPFDHDYSGGIHSPGERSGGLLRATGGGTLRAPGSGGGGTLNGNYTEGPENAAMAEVGGLISSLGSLQQQAQSLPLSAPVLPGLPQTPGYQPQATDYTAFNSEAD